MFLDKLANIEKRYLELETAVSSPEVINNREKYTASTKELNELLPIVEKFRAYRQIAKEIEDADAMMEEEGMKELAEVEKDELEQKQKTLLSEIEILLLPKDPLDDKNIIVEIRAGTGGEEAALFAGELLRMYLRYAERRGWKTEMLEANPTGLGGYKEVVFNIIGKGAYSRLKFEGGTHRVQRVPKTESSGRIHTSAVTVAILPEAEEVDVKIDDKDLRVDTYRAGGP